MEKEIRSEMDIEPEQKKARPDDSPSISIKFFNQDARPALGPGSSRWPEEKQPDGFSHLSGDSLAPYAMFPEPGVPVGLTAQYRFRAERAASHQTPGTVDEATMERFKQERETWDLETQTSKSPYIKPEFWFNRDSNIPLPLVARYDVLKRAGEIPVHVTYAEWERDVLVSEF